eukprot:13737017-Alexandrium_andersonii.AAC.1
MPSGAPRRSPCRVGRLGSRSSRPRGRRHGPRGCPASVAPLPSRPVRRTTTVLRSVPPVAMFRLPRRSPRI